MAHRMRGAANQPGSDHVQGEEDRDRKDECRCRIHLVDVPSWCWACGYGDIIKRTYLAGVGETPLVRTVERLIADIVVRP
jgi:hypothetical protein